jgi:hypothetical protein
MMPVGIKDLVDELTYVFADTIQSRRNVLNVSIELPEHLLYFTSDGGRIKQCIATLLNIFQEGAVNRRFKLDIHSFNNTGIIV